MKHQDMASVEGYTMAEMLVVLALLALVASLSFPTGMRSRTSQGLENQAMTIAAMLKAARMAAITRNTEASFDADLVRRNLSATGLSEHIQLGKNVGLSMLTARKEVQSGTGTIRFFPDGTSTGGTLKLEQGKRRIDINVDWLTGRIDRVEGGR
jgi:general secretion pathway protein H